MDSREAQPHHRDFYPQDERQRAYTIPLKTHHHSAASPVVHVLKTAVMLSPLIASEFVKDPSRTWKWSRIAIGAATILDQVDYAIRCHKDNERERCGSWVERSRSDNTERTR
jgi:hypothetical protein